MKNTENNITSSTAVVTEGQSTDTASLSNMAKVTIASILMAAASPTFTSCETDKPVDPVEQVDPNALNEEQQAFKDLLDPTNPKMIAKGRVFPSIIDGQPVVSIPVSPVPNNKNFTEAFQGFMDIELRVVNAKTGSYSITPIINRSSVEKILKKAEELEPGKVEYGIGILGEALDKTGSKRSLTGGLFIVNKDDNNPATKDPYLAQLPERFTLEELEKYNPNTTLKTSSFTLAKDESFRLGLSPATIGIEFDVIYQLINAPAEAQSIVRN